MGEKTYAYRPGILLKASSSLSTIKGITSKAQAEYANSQPNTLNQWILNLLLFLLF